MKDFDLSQMRVDLSATQSDFAYFLPAISTFYSSYVGKQRHNPTYVEPARIPKMFNTGLEGLNFLNPTDGYFKYKWGLYSAGHADLNINRVVAGEDMIRNRDPDSFLLGDSGGFQIAKGVWEGDWRANSGCAKAQKKRVDVLNWMEKYMNYGMSLDIPGWVWRFEKGSKNTCISSYAEAMEASKYNFEYWIKHRQGNCKFLTVLQGDNHTQADEWYQEMKKYSDPKHFPDNHFDGWAMGSQNKCDIHLVLKRLVDLVYDGLLESGVQDWIHYLGTSKLEWAMMFTDIQRSIRKYHNPTLNISFDCASPFLATANGQVYWANRLNDREQWSYRMTKCVDDKKYAGNTRLFTDVAVNDGYFESFINSPIIDRCTIGDICWYAPNQVNKINKVGRTSWDSFSYELLMGHNIYAHIRAVQDGNMLYDQGITPKMLVDERFDRKYFKDIVDAIFSAPSYAAAMDLVDEQSRWFMDVRGNSSTGFNGKKTLNSHSKFFQLFDEVDLSESTDNNLIEDHSDEFTTDEIEKLDYLEGHIDDL